MRLSDLYSPPTPAPQVLSEGKWDALRNMINFHIYREDGSKISALEADELLTQYALAAGHTGYPGMKGWYARLYEGLKHDPSRGPSLDRLMWFMRQYKYWLATEIGHICDHEVKSEEFSRALQGAQVLPWSEQPEINRVIEQCEAQGIETAVEVFSPHNTRVAFLPAFLGMQNYIGKFDEHGNFDEHQIPNEARTMTTIIQHLRQHCARSPNNPLAAVQWETKPWSVLKAELQEADRESMSQLSGRCPNPCPGNTTDEFAAFPVRRGDEHPPHEAQCVVPLSGGMGWWDLQAPFCNFEAESAQHCGNSPRKGTDDTILSLRKKLKGRVQGREMHDAMVSFILKANGSLTEMKGRQNAKPSPKYHRAIAVLLATHKAIKEVVGGGYVDVRANPPIENFCLYKRNRDDRGLNGWTDLDDELGAELHQERPEIYEYQGNCEYCRNTHGLEGECQIRGPLEGGAGRRRRRQELDQATVWTVMDVDDDAEYDVDDAEYDVDEDDFEE